MSDLKIIRRREGPGRPTVGVCACGREVELFDPLWNACSCGRWYSMTGQEVISPEAYDADPENTEKTSDIYNGGHDGWDW